MQINLPRIRIVITINDGDPSLRLGWPRLTLRRWMLLVIMVAISLAWIDWRERQQARWYLSNLRPGLPERFMLHYYALHKPWGFEIIGRLPMHLLDLLGIWLVLWLVIRMSRSLRAFVLQRR
jgi:hypothetical protein